jgi:hypothetical protein
MERGGAKYKGFVPRCGASPEVQATTPPDVSPIVFRHNTPEKQMELKTYPTRPSLISPFQF